MMYLKVTLFAFFKKHRSILKIIIISVVTNMVVSSVFFLMFMHTHPNVPREIVTINVLKIMDDYSVVMAQKVHSPDAIKRSAKLLSQKLENVLKINAKEKHLVIMPKQAIIQGAQDITPQIELLVFGKPETHP